MTKRVKNHLLILKVLSIITTVRSQTLCPLIAKKTCGLKSLTILKFDNFVSEFHNSSGTKKIGFNSCDCIKFSNIANFHAFHVWGKRIFY